MILPRKVYHTLRKRLNGELERLKKELNQTYRLFEILATCNIIKSAKEKVLWIFSPINAFRRQVPIDVIHLLREAIEHGVKVKILIPAAELEMSGQSVSP